MDALGESPACHASPPPREGFPVRHILYGLLAAASLLAFYVVTITVAQGWAHAMEQLAEDSWFVAAILAGFGGQVGLFTYMRGLHAAAPGAAGGMATSTGTSTAAMLACCAHHLTDVLAVVGLSGAAIFLNDYKMPLLWTGMTMNAAGVLYLLVQAQKQRRMMQTMARAMIA